MKESNPDFRLKNYLREAYFTYEFKKTSELFMEMRQNSVSLAIVLDEYGAQQPDSSRWRIFWRSWSAKSVTSTMPMS